MNEYELKDQEGRDIFKMFCQQQKWCKHIKDAEDKYSKWDNTYMSGTTQMVGEIKYRKEYDGSAFPDWILEVDKLKALQVIHAKMASKGISTRVTYINHFNDNYTLIWDLTDLDINKQIIKKVKLQKNDFDDEQIWKDVIYLQRFDAIFLGETDEALSIFKKNEDNDDEDELPFNMNDE